MTRSTDAFLDAKGLLCPLPVLRARKLLTALKAGERLRVEATDPSARADFEAFCQATGHRLVQLEEAGGVLTVLIEAGPRPVSRSAQV